MAASATLSNYFKLCLLGGEIDMSGDTIRALLMKSGFVFDRDVHLMKKNIKVSSGAITLTFAATGKTITRSTGSFITDGFVDGNIITTDAHTGGNQGPLTITDVQATILTVSESISDEGPDAHTITSDDELETGSGYTQDTKVLSGQALSQDDANDRAVMTCDDVSWTANGGSIVSPGLLLYDNTHADKVIIGYIDFDGDQTATNGNAFTVEDIEVRIT